MYFPYFSKTRWLVTLLCSVALIGIVGCDLQLLNPASPVAEEVSPAVLVPTPVNTPEPGANELIDESENQGRETTRALTAWVLPEFETEGETPGATIISQQLATFDRSHPEIQLIVEHKSIVGQGGLFEYFSTAASVAPNILPDLVLVPHNALPQMVAQGIIYPLDDLLEPEDIQDLFPVADKLITVNGDRYGYPYMLSGLTHAAYNTAVYSSTLPLELDQIDETNLKLAFPVAGKAGTKLLLQLYLDEGGRLFDENGNVSLETTPLLVALRRIQTLREAGAIAESVGAIVTYDEMWLSYKSGSYSLILTDNRRFLTEYKASADLGFSDFPGSVKAVVPMVDGWVWAISSADPARQALAIELLTWMSNGPNMGDWTFASQRLPARRTAMSRWPQDEYTQFLNAELETATVRPDLLDSNLGGVLQGAMQSLFATPDPNVQTIAENAISAINGN